MSYIRASGALRTIPATGEASSPTILVLGFSKGFTQARAFQDPAFEEIPFEGMRERLTQALRALGALVLMSMLIGLSPILIAASGSPPWSDAVLPVSMKRHR